MDCFTVSTRFNYLYCFNNLQIDVSLRILSSILDLLFQEGAGIDKKIISSDCYFSYYSVFLFWNGFKTAYNPFPQNYYLH